MMPTTCVRFMIKKKSLWLPGNAVGLLVFVFLASAFHMENGLSRISNIEYRTSPSLSIKRVPFAPLPLRVRDLDITLPRMSILVMPGEAIPIQAGASPALRKVNAYCELGKIKEERPGIFGYIAPNTPGEDEIVFSDSNTRQEATLKVFILIPRTQVRQGKLRGYRIGTYSARYTNPIYTPPPGFFEVTGDNENTWLTPHIRVCDVLCKQTAGYPKYMFLQEKLLIKLEHALAECKRKGLKVKKFSFISGYRTPSYNDGLANVGLSRHQYGDAADVYIDNDGDGYMDDLNHDGKLTIKDAEVMVKIVDAMDRGKAFGNLKGGLGTYNAKPGRTSFIHIDTRGSIARWVD